MLRAGLMVLLTLTAQARLLTPVRVQAGEGHMVLAREVVAEGSVCPVLRVDGADRAMQLRSAPPQRIREGATVHDFGFTLMEKEGSGWKLTLKGAAAQTQTRCAFHKNMVACRM